jgi:hypothetical protein
MWSYLKQWISAGVGKRPSGRRVGTPRFRGQIEQLEARTVLSATMETAAVPMEAIHVDFEVRAVVILSSIEGPIAAVVWQPPFLPAAILAARWEDPRPMDFEALSGDRGWPSWLRTEQALAAHTQDEGFAPSVQNHAWTGAGAIHGGKISMGLSANLEVPWDESPSGTPGDFGSPISAKSPEVRQPVLGLSAGSSFHPSPGDVVARVASYYSPLTTLNSTSTATVSLTSASQDARDAIFGEYSPNLLLLAASGGSQRDRDLDGDLDDKLEVHKKSDDLDDSGAALVDQDVPSFLDALQHERDAVDAVLAELHDLAFDDDQPVQDTSPTAERQHADVVRDAEQNYPPVKTQAVPAPQFNQAEGGMVLLEPSGDANSSAYDLAAVYLKGMNDNQAVPQGVEASVGMYQALDVGASESRPTSRENLPIAQPAATIRPSVSAENAPAKKSDQPS